MSFRLPDLVDPTVGREREVSAIRKLLEDPAHRIITLTGPAGVGKTRLSILAANAVRDEFDLGVRFVSLASIQNAAQVPYLIHSALGLPGRSGVPDADRVAAALEDRTVLLLLDNLEHIAECGSYVHDLVCRCGTATVLATSRVPLHVGGEMLLDVEPLGLPDSAADPGDSSQSDAVELFRVRASGVLGRAGAIADESEIATIASICKRLDGLPLAIELAAARSRILSPADMLERLDRRLPLLTSGRRHAQPRMKSMSDAIGWSYDLLSAEEQSLFRVLSVFVGGFSLEAAEGMAIEARSSPIDVIEALEDHSLIRRTSTETGSRFMMLETVREFGLTKASDAGELEELRDRHGSWFAQALEGLPEFPHSSGSRSQNLYLPGDHDNLRAAVEWALANHRPTQAALLAEGLFPYWNRTGQYRDSFSLLTNILDDCTDCADEVRVFLLRGASGSAYLTGEIDRAMQLIAEALDTCRDLDDKPGIGHCNNVLGLIVRWRDPELSVNCLTTSFLVAEELRGLNEVEELAEFALNQRALSNIYAGNIAAAKEDACAALVRLESAPDASFNRGVCIGTLSWIDGLEGNVEKARALGEQALNLAEASDVNETRCLAHRVLGEAEFAQDRHESALRQFQKALYVIQRVGFPQFYGFILAEIAMTAWKLGQVETAARLWGTAEASWDRFQTVQSVKRYGATWTGQFTLPSEFAANENLASDFDSGRSLPEFEAYALAMQVRPNKSPHRTGPGLTARQLEVLTFLNEGATNQAIANQLFLSKRTVDGHVSSIFGQLGVSTRGAAVAVARERGLL